MDVTANTTAFFYGGAFVLSISLISLLLSESMARLINKMLGGKKDVE